MALLSLPSNMTSASLGYRRSVLLVRGTTWTRLRNLFDASLLTITAGRFFLISPPTEGSKLTHQTSPLFMRYVLESCLGPIQGFCFSLFVLCHLGVCQFEILTNYVRANQCFNKFA